MKLTRQGVRDLGGNSRRREAPSATKEREFHVDVGADYGTSGLMLRINATSAKNAIAEAGRILRTTYSAERWMVIQVADGRDIVWDYMNGFLRRG